MSNLSINVALVGCSGCGKTTYLTRYTTGRYVTEHIPSESREVTQLRFPTSIGEVQMIVTTMLPAEYKQLTNDEAAVFDAVIVMFSLTDANSLREAKAIWFALPASTVKVMCGNKVDLRNCMSVRYLIRLFIPLPYYSISSKSNYNFEKPWLSVVRQVYGVKTIEAVLMVV